MTRALPTRRADGAGKARRSITSERDRAAGRRPACASRGQRVEQSLHWWHSQTRGIGGERGRPGPTAPTASGGAGTGARPARARRPPSRWRTGSSARRCAPPRLASSSRKVADGRSAGWQPWSHLPRTPSSGSAPRSSSSRRELVEDLPGCGRTRRAPARPTLMRSGSSASRCSVSWTLPRRVLASSRAVDEVALVVVAVLAADQHDAVDAARQRVGDPDDVHRAQAADRDDAHPRVPLRAAARRRRRAPGSASFSHMQREDARLLLVLLGDARSP